MGSNGTAIETGKLTGKIGSVSYSIGNVVIQTTKKPTPAAIVVQYVGERGRHLSDNPSALYHVPAELVQQFAAYAGEAGLTSLKIRVIVHAAAAMRKQTQTRVTLGTAFIGSGKAEIYWKNIFWQKGDSAVRQTFLSVVAHEVGHLVHYNAVGDREYYSIPRVEREYAAEKFVGLVLGPEYVRPVATQFYKD